MGDWVMLCTQPREQVLKHCHVGLAGALAAVPFMGSLVHMVWQVPSRGFTAAAALPYAT